MKILLFGCDGQVGWELRRALAPMGRITALNRGGRGELHGDLAKPEQMVATVEKVMPDVIVNSAAYTAVDKAETEPQLARLVNSNAPGVLARQAREIGAWLVHFSTDYVFDGTGERPWREDDSTGPCNTYGITKLEGENAIRGSGCSYLLLRTSWVYSARGANFLRTVYRMLNEGAPMRFVNDQYGAPTGAELIADVTARVLEVAMRVPEKAGTYHLAAAGETTWYDYARFIVDNLSRADGVRLTEEHVIPITTEEFTTVATRPRNSRLCCDRLRKEFQLHLPDWREGVRRTLSELKINADQESM